MVNRWLTLEKKMLYFDCLYIFDHVIKWVAYSAEAASDPPRSARQIMLGSGFFAPLLLDLPRHIGVVGVFWSSFSMSRDMTFSLQG